MKTVTLKADTRLYRVAGPGWGWPAVVSGNGALSPRFTGNRYNSRGERTVYAAGLWVTLTEAAYYAAADMQRDRVATHFRHPGGVSVPLEADYVLWCFDLAGPMTVVDVTNSAAGPGPPAFPGGPNYPGLILRTPSRDYRATQDLATHIRSLSSPTYDGLFVPSVRATPGRYSLAEPSYVFFLDDATPVLPAKLVGAWKLIFTFPDLAGRPATGATPQIGWADPHFFLDHSAAHSPVPPGPNFTGPEGLELAPGRYQLSFNNS
jgi:hypothetical protein